MKYAPSNLKDNTTRECKAQKAVKDMQGLADFLQYSRVWQGKFVLSKMHGLNLQTVLTDQNTKLNLRSATELALKLLNSIEAFHRSHFVHGDIQLKNILLGATNEIADEIVLIDYSSSEKYIRRGKHVSQRKHEAYSGNTMSVSARC